MNKHRLLLSLALAVGGSLLLQQHAAAHVLLRDSSNSTGVIVHITPNDNPAAGQLTRLFFDTEGQLASKNYATLRIVNRASNTEATTPVTINDTSLKAEYTFPEQGNYELTLIVSASQLHTFTYNLRISRGSLGSETITTPRYPLATFALVLCGSLFLMLMIVAVNRRKELYQASVF